MSGQLHHDLANLAISLSSMHFNMLMLTSQRGGVELRDKTEKLCKLLEVDSAAEEVSTLAADIEELLTRTQNDGSLISSELERMERTIDQIKEIMPAVRVILEKQPPHTALQR